MHVGTIVLLYALIISFLNLAFNLIDAIFPAFDVYYYTSISWPTAMLIVLFPLFIFLSSLAVREYELYPEKKNLGIRRWLVYLTLFVAGAVIAGDLVTVLYRFLNGDTLTASFLLKALVVLITTGAVFSYYIAEIRDTLTLRRRKIDAVISAVVIIAVIIAGFAVIGSPRTQRLMKIDAQRVSSLQEIQYQVANHWQRKGALPSSLSDLTDSFSGYTAPQDPETGKPYTYQKVSALTFKLCADFALVSREIGNGYDRSMAYPAYGGFESENWKHEAGNQCFERTIDPDNFPPTKI